MKNNNNNINLGNIPNLNIKLSNTNDPKETNSETEPLLASHIKNWGNSKKHKRKPHLRHILKTLKTLKNKAYHKYKSLRLRKSRKHFKPRVSLLNRLGAHTYTAKRKLLKRLATLRSQKRKPSKNNWLVNWNSYTNNV